MERERVGSDVKFPSLKKLTRDHRVEMVYSGVEEVKYFDRIRLKNLASKEGLFEIVDDRWQNPSNCLIGSVKFNVEAGVQWMGVGPLVISQGIVVVAVGLSMVVEHVVLIMEEAMVMAGEVGSYDTENCAN
ncbi:hypothetical protein GQ457_05G026630 [Hibiscus cannabinus]